MKIKNTTKLREETYKNLQMVFLGADIEMFSKMAYVKNPKDSGLEVKELEKPICIKNDNLIGLGGLCIEFYKDGIILWQQNHSLNCFKWKESMVFQDYPSKTVFMMKLALKVMDFLNK